MNNVPIKLDKPIETQTPEQAAKAEALLAQYQAWAYGDADNLQTPIDAVVDAVNAVVDLAKVPRRQVIVVDGPLLAQLAANVLRGRGIGANLRDNLWVNLWANLWDILRDNLRDNLMDNLWANLWANLMDNLRDNLWANLWANLMDNLRDNLWVNLWANLWDILRDNLRDNLMDNLWANLKVHARLEFEPMDWFGQSGQYWICFYDHIANALMPNGAVSDEMLMDIAKVRRLHEVGVAGALTFENAIIVWRRPVYAKYDRRNRPHCATGPQVLWQDGFAQYAIGGVQVPHSHKWIVEDAAGLSAEKAMSIENVELRRVAIEQMGIERFLAGAEATVVDECAEVATDGSQTKCRLLRLKVDGGRADLALTEVQCTSTRKVIHEEVPLEVATSYQAARAWKAGLSAPSPQSESLWET